MWSGDLVRFEDGANMAPDDALGPTPYLSEHIVRCGIVGKPFDISGDPVYFEIHTCAYRQSAERGNSLCMWNVRHH